MIFNKNIYETTVINMTLSTFDYMCKMLEYQTLISSIISIMIHFVYYSVVPR
jgi:hypothetical protein